MPSELPCTVSSMNSDLPLDRSTIFLSGFAPKRLTQKPTSPNHRLPLTAFETHNDRSTFAAGTALRAPFASFADPCTSVSDKEYFPYESQCGRREPRRRHARACPRRVCWPLCAWTIRATIRGARPYGLRCLHWDPRRNAHGVCQMLYRHGWSVTL